MAMTHSTDSHKVTTDINCGYDSLYGFPHKVATDINCGYDSLYGFPQGDY